MERSLLVWVLCLWSFFPLFVWAQSGSLVFSLQFPTDLAVPETASLASLEEEINLMIPSGKWQLTGHADSVGTDGYNLALSEKRVAWTVQFLIEKGWAPWQIQSDRKGETAPLVPNSTPEGRAKNRRVVLRWTPLVVAGDERSARFERLADHSGWRYPFYAEEGLTVTTPGGVKLVVPPDALFDSGGHPVFGKVELIFRNFRDRLDQAFANFSLDFEANGQWLLYNSGGMFEIRAVQEGDTLQLDPNRPIAVEYPYNDAIPDLSLFKFRGLSGNWQTLLEALPAQPTEQNPGGSRGDNLPPLPPVTDPLEKDAMPEPSAIPAASPRNPLSAGGDSLVIDSTLASSSESEDDPDTLRIELFEPGGQADSCQFTCFSLWFGQNLFGAQKMRFPTRKCIDLRFYYTLYSDPDAVRDYYCDEFGVKIKPGFPDPSGNPTLRVIPQRVAKDLPNPENWVLNVRSSPRRFHKIQDQELSNVILKRKPNSERLKIKSPGHRPVRVSYLGSVARADSKVIRKTGLEKVWTSFLTSSAHQKQDLADNLSRFLEEGGCKLTSDPLPADPLALLTVFKKRQRRLRSSFGVAFQDRGSLGLGCVCPLPLRDTTIIIELDTIAWDSGGLRDKIVYLDTLGVPIVLLDEFGVYNFDGKVEIPNPTWVNARYVDEAGKPLQLAKAFLLIGEINGVVGLSNPAYFRRSAEMQNMILGFGPTGPIYYCPADRFPQVKEGANELVIPLITVPWKPGDDPVDLRKQLPFD